MKEIYSKTVEELYKEFDTSCEGLTNIEALKRLEKNGENKLKEQNKKSNLVLFLSQFNDFMIILLIFASVFSAFVSYFKNESYIDSIVIIVIVLINAILSFIQEKKADKAIEELNKMFVSTTYVIRDSKKELIDVKNLVMGDIVELEAGDYISFDGRIISSDSLILNEATLTGESISIEKDNKIINEKKELYERKNMVFAGCNVINGHAFVLVTSTGMNTELGKIANSLLNQKEELTPLQKKVNQISKVLTYLIVFIIILMIIIGLFMQNDFLDVIMLAISLAVAAIPEGLSSVITIILSIGMTSMAKKNVIIRKMSSVETLGSTDVICSDKTGTITQNKMVVKNVFVNDKLYDELEEIENNEILFNCASMCHNIVKNDENYIGDETEVAIVKYLENKEYKISNNKRIKEYPFDSDRKMMSVLYKIDNEDYYFTKGSLDSILCNCSKYIVNNKIYNMTDDYKNKLLKIEKKLSLKSLRLLAFSYKKNQDKNIEKNMIFIGLIGMMDPPREQVSYAIKTCLKSGIKPIMITGDSINTAIAIAKDVGIIDDGNKAIEGKKIDEATDNELLDIVDFYQVYARISPTAKLRIVNALQKKGLIVAMTGDGVNDAPAIQKADIGIGMGITGTEVVKKVADCILVDDSFSTIVAGVEEGRRITSNIKKIMLYLIAGNIVEVILVFASLILNKEMFSTLQLLWINLITDSIPAIMLAFEKPNDNLMENSKENKYSETFFTPFLTAKIFISAFIKSIVMLILFMYFVKQTDLYTAGSLMFIYLILHELLFSYSCKNIKKSVLNKSIFDNKKLNIGVFLIAIIQIIILTTPINKIFIVSNIELKYIIMALFACFSMFIMGELVKPLYSKLFKDYKD